MCRFCKPDTFCEEEITRKIAEEPIDMGQMLDVLNLNAWVMKGEDDGDIKIQLCLSESVGNSDIAVLDIPIEYCPMCGRKL